MTESFLSETHFLSNLHFHESELYQDWKRFLHIFCQKSPKCTEHPDTPLQSTLEKRDHLWVGKLVCPKGDYSQEWTWPNVVNIWTWSNELQSHIQNTQVKTIQFSRNLIDNEVDKFIQDLLTTNKININAPKQTKEQLELWEELGALEATWNEWLGFKEFVRKRQLERIERQVETQKKQNDLLEERERLWKLWLDKLVQQTPETQQKWSEWGETTGWEVLEHEGMPTPRRLQELLKEAPELMTPEIMESWFKWSNVSRDYISGMKVSEGIITNLTEEGEKDNATLIEYYIDFPQRGMGVSRGRQIPMGDSSMMMKPGIFTFPDVEDMELGQEMAEELMENPDEVIDAPKSEEQEYDPEYQEKEKMELMKEYIMKDMDLPPASGGGGIDEINGLDENFRTQPEKGENEENKTIENN